MRQLYIEYENCVGCELCAMRCSLEKTGRVNPALGLIHLVKVEADGIMLPAACRHCDEPKCIPACPVDCITKDQQTGLVSIDAAVCTGCKMCTWACPYEGPVRQPSATAKMKNIKALCDLCGGAPKCVTVCPTGTLRYVEVDAARQLKKDRAEAELAALLEKLAPPPPAKGGH
jgi:anaerobic carbon-monoxide dehydrogenase iron sulfur subunit